MSLDPPPPDRQATSPIARIRAANPLLSMIANLWAGLRFALFFPISREQFRLNADQVVLLLLVGLATQLVGGFIDTEPDRVFNPAGLAFFATGCLALIFGCYVAARIHKAPFSVVPLMTVICSWAPLIAMAVFLIRFAPQRTGLALVVCVTIWIIASILRSIRLVLGKSHWRAAASVAVLIACSTAIRLALPPEPFWYTDYDWTDAADAIDVEGTYYAQPSLVDRVTASLQPQRPGVVDLEFVGFAGYAHQDVFLREAQSVGVLFSSRFDTKGRSVQLINNPKTIDDLPLANAHNLASALDAVAAVMDRDEDMLFLFLTSHGGPGVLSVEFWPLQPNDLSAEELNAILDQSGIRNRVIVVSACYSGSFIDALKDENSLIMTASRHDRTSFGCANEREFTYFGEAYFDQALRTELAFVEAFETAARTVEAREREAGLTPSMPQIFVGDAIQPKLTELEQRLQKLNKVMAEN